MIISIGERGLILAATRQGIGIDFQFVGGVTMPIGIIDEDDRLQLYVVEGIHIRLPFFEMTMGVVVGEYEDE